jgi:tetratricopeptide (TPR) repeat protein
MIHYAFLAIAAAEKLDAELLGAERVGRCRSRAHAALGNALRIVGRFDEAQSQINRAYEIYLNGTPCTSEEARLLDLQASLYASQRRFEEACEILKKVYGSYRRNGEDHLAGRALISQAVYAGYSGLTEEALQLIDAGLLLVDGERDPDLVAMARHNQAYLLADLGRYREARTLLFEIRLFHGGGPKKISALKLRWLEGRINRGLGQFQRAERDFLEARQGCIDAGLPFQAALCGFELGLVRTDLGRTQEARRDVLEAASVFLELNIGREALMTVAFVRHAFEQELEARALLERTIDLLSRNDHGPRLLLKVLDA